MAPSPKPAKPADMAGRLRTQGHYLRRQGRGELGSALLDLLDAAEAVVNAWPALDQSRCAVDDLESVLRRAPWT